MNLMQFSPNRGIPRAGTTAKALAVTFALGAVMAVAAQAEDVFHPVLSPGGINVKSNTAITGMSVSGSNVTLTFKGLQAPYDVHVSTDLFATWTTGATTAIKYPHYTGQVTVSNVEVSSAQFRMSLRDHAFLGPETCNGCHSDKVGGPVMVQGTNANGERIMVTNGISGWLGTGHAKALNVHLDASGNLKPGRESCVVCHSTGHGQPGGYVNMATTPKLAHVGCEACHGPAGQHVNVSGRNYHPVASLASETCGGCHTGSHHPTYDEWTNSLHFEVTEDVAGGSSGMTNAGTTGFGRQMSCGGCHSGATRMAMLKDWEARRNGYTNSLILPSGWEAAETPVTCGVCHDPHEDALPAQLRNPMYSTNYYTLFTTSVSSNYYWTNVFGERKTNVVYYNHGFANQYNPDVQICAQCHNSRGARWDGRSLTWTGTNLVLGTSQSFSRPPHHSPQYNVLIGLVQPDYLTTNSQGVATNLLQRHGTSRSSSTGAYNTNQCVTCHVVSYAVDAQTNVTGHTFAMNTRGCTTAGCHGSVPSIEEEQHRTTNGLTRVVSLLNQWALTKGPILFNAADFNRSRQNCWEYSTIGALAGVALPGPRDTNQIKLPDAIKQARFNAYMVLHDGSLGVHNPRYSALLISDAENKVLSQFGLANFKANTLSGFAPLTVNFTNLGVGVTGYDWNFGDGNTSTLANPANTYTTPGIYTVSHTATDGVASETVTRTNYITVVQKPVVSYTATPMSGTAPLTVTFTNTSTDTNEVTAWRYTVMTGYNISSSDAVFTYTNAGSYKAYLRASTPAGSVYSPTNTITVSAP